MRRVPYVLSVIVFGFLALVPAQASAEAINLGDAGRDRAGAAASFAASVYSGSADMANLITPVASPTAIWDGLPITPGGPAFRFPVPRWPRPRPARVSEPSTLLMMGIGLLGVASLARRRLKADGVL